MSESMSEILAREAAEAEARAEAEERGEVEPAPGQRGRKPAKDPSQVYAVRIPVSKLRRLRELADELDTTPSALIRQLVIERLNDSDVRSHEAAAASSDTPRESAGRELKLGPRRRRAPTALAIQHYERQVRRRA
jgi:hypothetical protein